MHLERRITEMAQKNESPLSKLFAEIHGGTTIVVPNKFKLPTEYQKFDLPTIFNAWGILTNSRTNSVGGDKIKLYLPKGWEVQFPDSLNFVRDSNGSLRMRLLENSVTIELPVVTRMNGDHEFTEWVEVLHRGEEVFRSTTFESITGGLEDVDPEDEDVPILSEDERESAGLEVYLSVKPYYDEAEAFVREHYPLLDKDPNAYW